LVVSERERERETHIHTRSERAYLTHNVCTVIHIQIYICIYIYTCIRIHMFAPRTVLDVNFTTDDVNPLRSTMESGVTSRRCYLIHI